jgi:hypothetical protein
MGCGLLMPDINNANAFVKAPIINIDDMPATQGKNGLDPFGFQGPCDEMSH